MRPCHRDEHHLQLSQDGTVRVWDLQTGEPALDPLTGEARRLCLRRVR
jgi:hypothetical protein